MWKVTLEISYTKTEYVFNNSTDACMFVETLVSKRTAGDEPYKVHMKYEVTANVGE